MRTEWIRALLPSAGAGSALAAGGVCAVLALMGAMSFGLWASSRPSNPGAMALPGLPSHTPASAADVEDAGADAAQATDARDTSQRRPRRPTYQVTAMAERPTARSPAIAPPEQATSRAPAAQPVRRPAAVSDAGHGRAPAAVVAATALHLPPPAGSLPQPVREAPGAVRGTAEAVLAPVERAADAAQSDVRAIADPVIAQLPDGVAASTARAAADVVAGALPGRAPSP